MRPYFAACVVSAFLGGLLAVWLTQEDSKSSAIAQDVRRQVTPRAKQLLIDDTDVDPRLRRQRRRGAAASTAPSTSLDGFTAEESVNIAVYDRTNRSVVHITTKSGVRDTFMMLEGPSEGSGSGSVLDQQGHILTNYHVIEGANSIQVTLYNGSNYRAGLVGRDPVNDIAVLRIDAPRANLYPVVLGESSSLRVGQKVLAIGNPFGLDRTLTVGILSSLNRTLPSSRTGREMKSIIQIDAALNRGNSGGPLLNNRGHVIGMNTAIASPSGANAGVGFAIPVNTIKRVVPELIEHGRVIRPVIGIASVHESERGLTIIEVTPGGPAERAGLRGFQLVRERERRGPFIYERTYEDRSKADKIVAVDGKEVSTGDDLLDIVESKEPGDRVVVRVLRESREIDVTVTLGQAE